MMFSKRIFEQSHLPNDIYHFTSCSLLISYFTLNTHNQSLKEAFSRLKLLLPITIEASVPLIMALYYRFKQEVQ